jgi:hypothetical protein
MRFDGFRQLKEIRGETGELNNNINNIYTLFHRISV